MQTVAETRHYAGRAEKLLSMNERDAVIDTLAAQPLQGKLIEGTGGLRKMRFARGGRGKSGGVRVVYYFFSVNAPIYLLEVFGKNEKANLSKAERATMATIVAAIKKELRGKRDE